MKKLQLMAGFLLIGSMQCMNAMNFVEPAMGIALSQGVNYASNLFVQGHIPAIAQQIKKKGMIAQIAYEMGKSVPCTDDFLLFCAVEDLDVDKVKRLIDLGVNVDSHKEHCPVDFLKNNDSLALATFIVERKRMYNEMGLIDIGFHWSKN